MNKAWINNKLVDINKARISIFDRGFMYGDGVFETMRSYRGVVFKIDEHMSRIERSLKMVRIRPQYTKNHLKKAIYELLETNKLKSAYIRLTTTRGEGRFGIEHKDGLRANTVIVAKEFNGYPDRIFKKGIRCHVSNMRQNEYSPLSGIKSLNFLNYIMARFEAKDSGSDEAIVLNAKGHVAEAVTSNVFIVKESSIATPSIVSGALPGITRSIIIEIAGKLNIKVSEKSISCKELLSAREVFLTNSLAEVLPVIKIDRKKIGRGLPGDITKLLHASYQKEVTRETLK